MAAKKLFDLAVVTGTYTGRDGSPTNRYKNVGSLIQLDDGNEFLTLDASFNPAGIPRKEGSDTITISMFTPKEKPAAAPPAPAANSRRGAAGPAARQDDAF